MKRRFSHRWAARDEQARFGDLFNLVCDPATFCDWERVRVTGGAALRRRTET